MILMKRTALAGLLGASALVISACSADTDTDSDALSIVTSTYPLEYVAAEVGGDLVSVRSLTPPGSDDHSLELSPRQVTDLERVDLVVTLSGYQNAMDDALAATSPTHVVDAADHVDLREPQELTGAPAADANVEDDHAHEDETHVEDDHAHEDETHVDDDHAHEDETHVEDDHADDHGHSHDGPDPHFWLDPARMALLAHPIADELASIDPEHADVFRANADDLVGRMEQLDTDFSDGLAQCESSTFVVSHSAFTYLAGAYDLDQQAIAGTEIDTEPSPKRVAEVTALVEDAGVDVIFTTSQAERSLVQALADEAGVRVDVLDAVATQVDDDVDYDGVMRTNLAKLRDALGCR
ncbi:zinc ABC transporter substrate-binding protein [Flaviflexus salsibiostraticola]|uniref:Zinc ABC transporter substrate-binding protein n=2 Tax=Flaviflexus salsibiostraticola TaxID=1282737 RepID=A0A3Q8WS34_9ACTO|nr:zinc ABC transporter substrate-binding protein [Flaviflexus salsibiostraticola]